MGNPNHGQDGRFSSGSAGAAASGDHQAASPSLSTRNVSGRAVSRATPVTRHTAPSVGTEPPRRLSASAAERVALNKRVDEGHFPKESNADIGMKTALIGTRTAPGKLDPRLSSLVSVAAGGKPRIRVRAR
jgi:hypothetical protein